MEEDDQAPPETQEKAVKTEGPQVEDMPDGRRIVRRRSAAE